MKAFSLFLAILAASVIAGCAGFTNQLPTVASCSHLSYERTGMQAHIEADCTL
jgi:hypothetical protein